MTAGRDAILSAARSEFAARGYDGTSIRAIAKTAGLSLSAMYYYFPSKQEALHALISTAFERYTRGARAAIEDHIDPLEQIVALVEFTVEFRIEHALDSRVLLRDTERLDARHHDTVREQQRQANDLFLQVVERGVELGRFCTPHPDGVVRAIIAMCNAVSSWYHSDGPLSVAEVQRQYTHFSLALLELDGPARGGPTEQAGPRRADAFHNPA